MKITYLIGLVFGFLLCLFFSPGSSVFASSINLSEPSTSSISDYGQEYQVKVDLLINTSDGTPYYLRGVFYQSGSTNYCGYTWNGSSWFNGPYSSGDGWKNFLPVTISSSSASVYLKAKLDTDDSGCKNSGNYNFKVERFTTGGSGTFDPQNEQTINITLPTPTPTPVPTSPPTSTTQPSNTPKPPTPTTFRSSSSNTTSVIKSATKNAILTTDSPAVLGEEASHSAQLTSEPNLSPTVIVEADSTKSDNLAKILIGVGGLFILGAAVWIGLILKKQKGSDPHP